MAEHGLVWHVGCFAWDRRRVHIPCGHTLLLESGSDAGGGREGGRGREKERHQGGTDREGQGGRQRVGEGEGREAA
eukprot:2913911-Rhodomonas_salina.1